MRSRTAGRVGVLFALVAVAVMLPGAGQSRIPPERDESSYTWSGAATMNVDVRPWGGGYVRSTPYLIDCPMACIRPWEQGRDVTLTAYATPGHKFESWEGACAGQGNPCTLKASGSPIDVTAVFSGQFVPPTPPASPAPVVSPSLGVESADLRTTLTGTGFNPNSGISIHFEYSSPSGYAQDFPNARTSDASGSWSSVFIEDCLFEGLPDNTHHGPVVVEVTATDSQGASASASVTETCP